MLGVIFGAMAVMLVLTVPIGVMLLAVALIPSLMDPGFMATVPFVLRNVVGGLNSTPLFGNPSVYPGRHHYGPKRNRQETVRCICLPDRR